MAGMVEFDPCRPGRARSLYALALEAAEQAEDLCVSAWVLANTSSLLTEQGNTRDSARNRQIL
jgi:hypothetical protein